ncbi:MAG TPA: glycosyltransferase family 2 protein [Ferruginibacter sp.]|nr:glycosyltransferase family 2 protein [Ferruginibacter sp.]
MEKVIAVVVTHNRQALLAECIAALRKQTRPVNSILVINNGSTDGTEAWLKNQPGIDFITQGNVGGAGGFSKAIQTGYERGYEWIWCMDDDGMPKEDALENLLAADQNKLQLLNCAVIDKEDKRSFVWKTGHYKTIDEVNTDTIEGIGHPFNGTLINRRIVERVGVPRSTLFVWGDETEYYYRITRKNKIPVVTVARSIHYHPACTFSIKKNWDHSSSWKIYFYLRNRLHIQKTKFSNRLLAFFGYGCFILAFAGTIMLYQKTDKFKKLNFIFWPVTDALTNNFTATPANVLHKLNNQSNKSYSSFLTTPLRSLFSAVFMSSNTERSKTATV